VKSGKPEEESGHVKLESDGIEVWVPSDVTFRDNQVNIQVTGFLWNTQIEAVSAVSVRRSSSCGG
jgi:hypothetical protein